MSDQANNTQNLVTGATGEISQDQMAAMLLGGDVPAIGEGETADNATATADSGKPGAAPELETKQVESTDTGVEKTTDTEEKVEPVILAKDGKHTIEYQKLVDAREEARFWKAKAEEASTALESTKVELAGKLMAAKQEDAKTGGSAAEEELAKLFQDFPELEEGVRKLVDERLAAIEEKIAPVVQKTEEAAVVDATEAHFKSIREAHSDFESVVESKEFDNWVKAQPSFVREQYQLVCEKGTAPQVIEMLDAYKGAAGLNKPAETNTSKEDVAGKAQEVVAKATAAPPASLSDLPAGAAAHHDEAEAVRSMNPMQLIGKFDGKSPQQIMDLMSRVI